MRADLLTARKARDKVTEVALKRALAAFENAEAPPARAGVTEGSRLQLTEDDYDRLIRAELAEAAAAAQQYEDGGEVDAAELLRAEAAVLERYLDDKNSR